METASQWSMRCSEELQITNIQKAELSLKGITIGYLSEERDILIELPLQRDKHYLILSTNILLENGTLTHVRKVLEIENNKKLKPIL